MRAYLLSFSTKYQILLIIGSMLVLAFVTANLFSLFFDVHQLKINTDLISAIYQVLGTIYAILLTFTLWGVWQNFTSAESSVQTEANALLDLVHLYEISHTWQNANIRDAALTYSQLVIQQEWAALHTMTDSAINARELSHSASEQIIKIIQNTTPQGEREVVIFGHTLTLLDKWLDARRIRLLFAKGNSARALWPLLITGAFVLFAFHGLFVAQTMGIWSSLLIGTSLIIGITFYLIFSLDCPFAGAPSIDSEPFHLISHILEKKSI